MRVNKYIDFKSLPKYIVIVTLSAGRWASFEFKQCVLFPGTKHQLFKNLLSHSSSRTVADDEIAKAPLDRTCQRVKCVLKNFVQILLVIIWFRQFIYVNWRWWCDAVRRSMTFAFHNVSEADALDISAIHYVYVPHSIELTDVTMTLLHFRTCARTHSLYLCRFRRKTLSTLCLQFIPRAYPSIGHISLHS